MTIKDIIRAWKDPLYRKQLSAEERAALPANPAGEVELSEAELNQIHGGMLGTDDVCTTVGHCNLTHNPCITNDYPCQGGNTDGDSCNPNPDPVTNYVNC